MKAKRNYKPINRDRRYKAIDENISKDHFAFKLKEFVQKIDVSFLEQYLSDSGRGPTPFPLWIPICIWMYAYKNGVLEYRQVSESCQSDDYYYWLSGGLQPSPSYCEQWKLRFLKHVPALVQSYKNYLRDHELMESNYFGLDGTKVEVWASSYKNRTEEKLVKMINQLI